MNVTNVALVRDGATGVAKESCSTVPVKLLAGADFVARREAGRMVTSPMASSPSAYSAEYSPGQLQRDALSAHKRSCHQVSRVPRAVGSIACWKAGPFAMT